MTFSASQDLAHSTNLHPIQGSPFPSLPFLLELRPTPLACCPHPWGLGSTMLSGHDGKPSVSFSQSAPHRASKRQSPRTGRGCGLSQLWHQTLQGFQREARLGLEGWKQSREKVGTVVSASSQSFQVLRRMDVWTDGGQGFRVGDHELELVPLSDNSQL